MEKHLVDKDKQGKYLVYCAGGYRSMIAASILKRHGCGLFKISPADLKTSANRRT